MNKVKVLVEGYARVNSDVYALKLSRSHALKIADFIIPGHGKMFKVKTS